MEKYVKKYHLEDPQQYEDEREYWRSKTPDSSHRPAFEFEYVLP